MSAEIGKVDEIIHNLNAPRRCRQCQVDFNEMDSIGTLPCRSHTGSLQTVNTVYGGRPDTYSCCSASPFGSHPDYRGEEAKLGCLRCDHTAEPGVPTDITLPADRAKVIFGDLLLDRNIIYNERTNSITIVRVGRASLAVN